MRGRIDAALSLEHSKLTSSEVLTEGEIEQIKKLHFTLYRCWSQFLVRFEKTLELENDDPVEGFSKYLGTHLGFTHFPINESDWYFS